MLLAVKTGAVTKPEASLAIGLLAFVPVSAKVPLAPLAGAVKVTRTPLIGVPDSETVTFRLVGKAVSTIVCCPSPAVIAILKFASTAPISTVVFTTRGKPGPR